MSIQEVAVSRKTANKHTTPVVYFDLIEIPSDPGRPRIKIGETGNHQKRRSDHAKPKFGVQFNVSHLCIVRGTRSDEQQLLKYFAKYRLDNEEETFSINNGEELNELVDYIRWLRDQYFVWVPDDPECKPIEDLPLVDSALWMASAERLKKGPNVLQLGLFDDFGVLNLPPRQVTVDDFYTNQVIIEAARATMQAIDLDPASHAVANEVVKATRFFAIHDNGLEQEWGGKVWLNPPFSQWELWVPKIIREWRSGRIESMCVLSATWTLTAQYFADIHDNCKAMCILRGRIPFWGGLAGSPYCGFSIFYFGDAVEAFAREFGKLGSVYLKS